jgi:hypothetical protein
MDNTSETSSYAYLPDELLATIMEDMPSTVEQASKMIGLDNTDAAQAIEILKQKNLIRTLESVDFTGSLVAVDGGLVVEKMTGMDILLSLAVGVEGLSEDNKTDWGKDRNQYISWQAALPHHEANARLAQGIMFLMELSVLAGSDHEIRIMDGSHLTPVMKLNSMLSARDEGAGVEYIEALKQFLKSKYNKIIPDIPEIVKKVFLDDRIIASTKYSSSRDIVDFYLKDVGLQVDDKTLFTHILSENEYLTPQPVGLSPREYDLWGQLHIIYNLDIPDVNKSEFDQLLEEAIQPIKTKDSSGHKKENGPDLFYTYFKPYGAGPAYKFEIKRSIAEDQQKLEKVLNSIKRQIIFPEIIEPYPQFLVDLVAKSVAGGMHAIKEAVLLSTDLSADEGNFNMLRNYRT